MWSVKCEVWGLECEGSSEKWEVWSVKCEVRSVKFEVWSAKSAVCSVRCGVSREGHGRDRLSLNYRSFMFGKLPPPACAGLCYLYCKYICFSITGSVDIPTTWLAMILQHWEQLSNHIALGSDPTPAPATRALWSMHTMCSAFSWIAKKKMSKKRSLESVALYGNCNWCVLVGCLCVQFPW